MSDAQRIAAVRQTAREVLAELLPELREAAADARADAVVPRVPAPPVPAVLRPSTWSAPPGPGEVIGDGHAAPAAVPGPATGARIEMVTLHNDADLQRFVGALLARLEAPHEREALRSGRLRFVLAPTGAARPEAQSGPTPPPVMRVEKGAVTERIVRQAAATGARLVLARGAVLTPLGRDQARALHVAIEREDT